MRHIYLLALVMFSTEVQLSQTSGSPEASAADAKIRSVQDSMRGSQVPMSQANGMEVGKRQLDMGKIKQQTIELNSLVNSVNGDVVNLGKGVLSAELSGKLKKIEKLAKDLRKSVE